MHVAILFVLCLLVISGSCSKNFKVTDWKYHSLSKTPLRRLFNLNLDACVSECSIRSSCEALNYRRRSKACELLNAPSPDVDEKAEPSVYILKKDITDTKSCACADNQVCRNGTCKVEECTIPHIDNCTIHGNMNQIGSKLKVECHAGYKEKNGHVYSECLPTGNWSFVPQCVLNLTDCSDLKQVGKTESGEYTVFLKDSKKPIQVYCDMATKGGGWTVFQRHVNDSVDFDTTFQEYEDGFGEVNGNYWMGLKSIHEMTRGNSSEIYFKYADKHNNNAYAYEQYGGFRVAAGSEYTLNLGKAIHEKTDRWCNLLKFNGNRFSTKDEDYSRRKCAELWHGGFWYSTSNCKNPNGNFSRMVQTGWKCILLKSTKMMFRRNKTN